jgi:hypothetical protein
VTRDAPQLGSGTTYVENLRRIFVRRAEMGDNPVAFAWMSRVVLLGTLVVGAIGSLLIWTGGTALEHLYTLTAAPVAHLHLVGVRHRWWALCTGLAVGTVTAVTIANLLSPDLSDPWRFLTGVLAAGWTGSLTYAAVTNLPRRPVE